MLMKQCTSVLYIFQLKARNYEKVEKVMMDYLCTLLMLSFEGVCVSFVCLIRITNIFLNEFL